jgi:hypothetical protein
MKLFSVIPQALGKTSSPTFAGLTITGNSVFGLNSSVFQPAVGGDSTTFFQVLDADGGTPVFNVDTINDRVIIQGSSGTQAFNVTGSVELEDTTTSTTGVIYKGATPFIHNFHHPTGDTAIPTGLNVFMGENVGNFTMGSTATNTDHASFNVGIGQNSLASNTTGNNNFGLGRSSLQNNTSGARNIAMGTNALFGNTTGFGNVGVGYFAGRKNATGSYNTLIGYQAGSGASGQSFSENTYIGREAGFSTSTGSSNIIIGFKAGHKQTTASNILLIDNQLRASAAAELTNALIYGVFNSTVTSQTLRFNVGNLSVVSGTPYQYLINDTHEDSDGGRESRINFKGEQSGGEETTLARIEIGHDGSADDEKGFIDFYTNDGNDGDSPTKQKRIQSTGDWVINKTSGVGIKVDLAAPTFGFADLLGDQFSRNTGSSKPTLAQYNGAVNAWQFSNGDEAYLSYHIPHDYVPGTDIHLHIHWSQNNTGANGGTIDFKYFAIYAKGHNQASGSVFTGFSGNPITATFSSIDIDDSGSGGSGLAQYQQHLTEVTISGASATSALFDRDDFEPDGVIELTLEMDANNLTGTASDPFIHYVDIHYQTTGIIGTKQKVPDFYI